MFQRRVCRRRSDRHLAFADADAFQLAQFIDIDQHVRGGEPQLHHRQQRMPPGQHLRDRAVLLQRRDCGG